VLASSVVFGGLLWSVPGAAEHAAESGSDSFPEWLMHFWAGVFTGDLGRSYRGVPVHEMVWRGALRSLPLIGAALVLSLGTGIALVVLLGERLGRLGRVLRTLAHAVSLCPVFLLGYLGLVLFAVPPEGARQSVAAVVILALGDGMLSDVLLGVDSELRALRGRDFVQSARLRGTPVWRHLVPHLALPLAQIAVSRTAWLIGGVLVLEMVLGIQGLGLIGYRAADSADLPLLVAITVFVTALVAGASLGLDVLRVLVDPRVRKDRRAIPREVA
jgi:peptide/nickel transport system permease protein